MLPQIAITSSKEKLLEYIKAQQQEYSIKDAYIYHIAPLLKTISIDQVREIRRELVYTPVGHRLVVFYEFQTAGVEAQNALLKLLEEHNPNDHFILHSTNPHFILPTILSRAQIIYLNNVEPITTNPLYEKTLIQLTKGNIQVISDPLYKVTSAEDAALILNEMIRIYRSELTKGRSHDTQILKELIMKSRQLQHNHITPQTVIDSMIMYIYKVYRTITT